MIFSLMARIDKMVAIAAEWHADEQQDDMNFLEAITSGGSHNDRNQDVIRAAHIISHREPRRTLAISELRHAADHAQTLKAREVDEIPF
jgi:hypothetical protein